MSDTYRFRILGCGSSGGVPRIGGSWGDCDPTEPRNRRMRCSLLVERRSAEGITRVLIDTSPDMRQQLLDADIAELDAVVYTHGHADHTHGLDDLRMIVINMRRRLPVWADPVTAASLMHRFDYAFVQPEGSDYPPILDLNEISGDVTIDGAGGAITLMPFTVRHGNIDSLGFRIGGLAYLPDVNDIPEDAWAHLQNLDVWIVDALRRTPHPSHAHLDLTLEWLARAAPKRGILTNLHVDLDYRTLSDETADTIEAAYDGLTIDLPAP